MQKITTFLWFDDQAEEAANFYVSVFSSRRGADSDPGPSKVVDLTRYGETGPGTPGSVMTASFQLAGQEFTAKGGEEGPCGWLKDRYGLSWQIVPTRLTELLTDRDPGRSQRAMQAMLQMKKIDIAALEKAADAV